MVSINLRKTFLTIIIFAGIFHLSFIFIKNQKKEEYLNIEPPSINYLEKIKDLNVIMLPPAESVTTTTISTTTYSFSNEEIPISNQQNQISNPTSSQTETPISTTEVPMPIIEISQPSPETPRNSTENTTNDIEEFKYLTAKPSVFLSSRNFSEITSTKYIPVPSDQEVEKFLENYAKYHTVVLNRDHR